MILKITCNKCNQQYTIDCNDYGYFFTIYNYFYEGKITNKEFDFNSQMFNENYNNLLICHNCKSNHHFKIQLID